MLLITTLSSRAIEESVTLRSKISTLCSHSQLLIFYNIVQLLYVGTDTYDSKQIMSDISHAFTTLKLEFQLRGKNITLTPEDIYRRHIKYLPLPPSNAMTWSFSLVTLFIMIFLPIYRMLF